MIPPRGDAAGAGNRAGHVLIFVLLILVVITLVALWYFDLNKILYVKGKARNAGDAAALAGARWQGISLNLIGELNLLQMVALTESLTRGETEFPDAGALADLRARLGLAGPLLGVAAAQQAAKNNGIFVSSAFTDEMRSHALEVASTYPDRFDPPYQNQPSPPTAWDDYASMLSQLAAEGMAAQVENRQRFEDFADWSHPLLNPSFYDAIATADWCWFKWNALGLIQNYRDWRDWPALQSIQNPAPSDSEFFGLGLTRVQTLAALPAPPRDPDLTPEDLFALWQETADQSLPAALQTVAATWTCYAPDRWIPWEETLPDDFPFESAIRPEYNLAGADVAVRIEAVNERHTPGGGADRVTWTAAAKPFGLLGENLPVTATGLILPAFTSVRLIPVDASSAPATGSRPGWALHIYEHVENIVAVGPAAFATGCWYCDRLTVWEEDVFREDGVDWITQFGDTCRRPTGGGGGGGGGSRRGH